MKQKYSEFKKFFVGDSKLNIVALDKRKLVLGHIALILTDNMNIVNGAKILYSRLKDSERREVDSYEVTFPTTTQEEYQSNWV